jgi:hypothetical protein
MTKRKAKTKAKTTGTAVAIHKGGQDLQVPRTMMQMVVDATKDKAVDVAKMRELLALLKEEQARMILNPLILQVQSEVPRIVADTPNPHTKSKYAKLEKVSNAIDPIMKAHGLGITWSTADSPLPNHYRVVGNLIHKASGAERQYFLDAPSDAKGPQGGGNKSEVQGVGSTVSYLRRYIKCLIFDITIRSEDRDGVTGAAISAEDVKQIVNACAFADLDEEKFCTAFQIAKIADLPASKKQEALDRIAQYRNKGFQAKPNEASAQQ